MNTFGQSVRKPDGMLLLPAGEYTSKERQDKRTDVPQLLMYSISHKVKHCTHASAIIHVQFRHTLLSESAITP